MADPRESAGKPFETGRRFVNTWECDENGHLNVQFYAGHFEDAEAHFWIASGLDGARRRPGALTRLQRFHNELHAGDGCILRSALVAGPSGQAVICHFMDNMAGRLAATCLTGLDAGFEEVAAAAPKAPHIALPVEAAARSIGRDHVAGDSADELLAAGFVPTYRGVVLPRDCGASGEMTAQLYVARFSDAASHFWHHLGIDREWRRKHGVGTVAVESKLTIFSPLKAGDAVLLLSGLTAHAAKTITFQHQVFDLQSKKVAAVGEVTALAMDLEARRAIGWGESELERMTASLCVPPGA